MRFSVVIPTLGRSEQLRETLASLDDCDPPADEVVIVDGDPARSAEPVADGRVYVPSERGLTRQRNAGIRRATGDVLVFADDDVTFDPHVFSVLARAYEDPSVVGATVKVDEPGGRRFGGKTSPVRRLLLGRAPEGSFTRGGYPVYVRSVDEERDVEVMPGCFMSARREHAERVGFDEELPGYGLAEDEDFSYRLSRLGRVRYLPQATVVHRKTGFATQDPRALSRAAVVNRAYLFRKNFPQTPLAKLEFGGVLLLMLSHRIANGDLRGSLGLLEGVGSAWRPRT
jgi:GT2 family glycosyltransferase